MSRKDREALSKNLQPIRDEAEASDHGVIRASGSLVHQLSYLPGCNIRVAKSLAALGKTFSEITQMSKSDLMAVHGVGEKTASTLHAFFNQSTA